MNTTSHINLENKEDYRPYSQLELQNMRLRNMKQMKTNNDFYVVHTKCRHFYKVKKYSKKERDMKEADTIFDIGNCSMCWSIRNNSNTLSDEWFNNSLSDYLDLFYDEAMDINNTPRLTLYMVELENTIMRWINNVDDYSN